jgi:hypothetical protein
VSWSRVDDKTGTEQVAREQASALRARFYGRQTGRPIFGEWDRTIHFPVTPRSDERRLG